MGFHGGPGRGGDGSAQMGGLMGGGSSHQGGWENDGGNFDRPGYSVTFANGGAGNHTPLRPYMGWDNSQSNGNGTTTTSGSDGSTTTAPATATTSTPTSATPSNPAANSDGPGFQMNRGGTFGFMGVGNTGGGGPGFIMGGNSGGMGRGGGSNPFNLNSGSTAATAVQTAFDALKTELKNDVPSGAKPSYASIGTLMDDLDAIKNGTLTGSDATTKVQADEAAALTAIGVTADQITAIQADEAALVAAIKAANTLSSSSDGSTAVTSSASPHDPMEAMTDVPLLPFLTQLRQNDPSGSPSTTTSPTSTGTVDTPST